MNFVNFSAWLTKSLQRPYVRNFKEYVLRDLRGMNGADHF